MSEEGQISEAQSSNNHEIHPDYAMYAGSVRWIILIAVLLGTILEVLDVSIVNVAIPDMMGNLGATLDQIGWVSTGYIIANVIILPLTGFLSAYFGRRKYLAGSIILFTAASFFCGTSVGLNELVFFRIIQGIGGAALLSTAQATLLEVFPPQQLGMIQAIFGMGVVVAPTLGPTLGGYITDNYSWPWIFFINIPIGITAASLTLLFLKDSQYHGHISRKVDWVGIALLALGVGCLQGLLEKGNREGWLESPLICWLAVLSLIGLVSFTIWELKTKEPAIDLRILKNRGFTAGVIFSVVLGFGLYGGIFVLPIFLQQIQHFTAEQTGLILLPGGLATGFMMPFVGRFVSRYPPRNLVAIGSVGIAASMFLLHDITLDTSAENLLFPLVLRGAALGFLFVPLNLATLLALDRKDLGYGTGLFNLMRQLGGSVGIAFLATLVDHRAAFHRIRLVDNINVYSTAALDRLNALQHMFVAKGSLPPVARQQALSTVDQVIQRQSYLLSFEDAFLIMGIAFVLALPLILLFRKGGLPKGAGRVGGGGH